MSLETFTEFKVVIICIDSQVAIIAVHFSKNKLGQYILRRIILAINCIRQKRSTVEIYLVFAYIGFCGNETINNLVKKVMSWRLKKFRHKKMREKKSLSTVAKV